MNDLLLRMVGPQVDPHECPKHSPEWLKVLAEIEARDIVHTERKQAARELQLPLEPSDED